MKTLFSPEPVALWWKGKVRREGDLIIPVERLPYNPFLYYSPAGVRTPKDNETRSLPYRFLEVDVTSKDAVMGFVEQYGVLGNVTLKGWEHWAQHTYKTAFSAYESLFIEKSYSTIGKDILGLPPIPSLACPMNFAEFVKAYRELQETIDWMLQLNEHGSSRSSGQVEAKIRRRFGQKLSMVRPYATWNKKEQRLQTGWDAGSLESLLYLMVLHDCQGKGEIRRCPWCLRTFMADRPKLQYCSKKCGNSFRVDKVRHPEKHGHKRSVIGSRKEKR